MACFKLQHYPKPELKIISSKKVLTQEKTTLNRRSAYLYGFNGKEKDDEVKGSGNSLDFGARIYDARLGKWLSVDPLHYQYIAHSPYSFVFDNPVAHLDPDGKRVKGFSVDDKTGEVTVDREKASSDALKVYDAMSKTETGKEAFKNYVTSETEITLKVTDKKLKGNAHGKTEGEGMTANGYYQKATVTISTAKTGDRFDMVQSDEEMINVIGVHESVHATNKEQISKDTNADEDISWSWELEALPLNYEYTAWKEYRKKYGGDLEQLRKLYEEPSEVKKDPTGKPKPAIHGVDENGNILTAPEE
jgi:RHS repeat-associated protein